VTVSPKRQQLADELVRVRRRAGITGRGMAVILQVKQAQLYRYDHAVTTPSIPKVRTWLDACRAEAPEAVSDEDRARILELAEEAHAEPRTWKAFKDAETGQDAAAEQDEEAVEVWSAESVLIDGLLQTPEYAAAAVRRADLHGQFNHAKQVTERLTRQARLFEPGRRWHFLMAERLLSWSPGVAALMPPQRARLLSLAAVEGVEVAVIPDDAVLEPSGLWWSPFTIIQPREGEKYAVAEQPHGEVTYVAADEVESFVLLWKRLWAAAVAGDAAVEFIRGVSTTPT